MVLVEKQVLQSNPENQNIYLENGSFLRGNTHKKSQLSQVIFANQLLRTLKNLAAQSWQHLAHSPSKLIRSEDNTSKTILPNL